MVRWFLSPAIAYKFKNEKGLLADCHTALFASQFPGIAWSGISYPEHVDKNTPAQFFFIRAEIDKRIEVKPEVAREIKTVGEWMAFLKQYPQFANRFLDQPLSFIFKRG